jgi:hypothetical protein
MQTHAPRQRALPMFGQAEPEQRPVSFHKAVRDVSKETFNVLADTGALGAMTTKVMRSLKYYINRHEHCPTPAELTRDMFQLGVINRDSVNLVAPRLTELGKGRVVKNEDGTRSRIGGQEIDYLPLRICTVTGNKAHPVRPREKGSEESR